MAIVTRVAHSTVAGWLGYESVSGVSRLRSGQRAPSRGMMIRIEKALNYTIRQQVLDLESSDPQRFYDKLEERILHRARLGANPVADAIRVDGVHESDRD